MKHAGFTLIELLLLMGIFTVLVGLTTINVVRPQTKASLDSQTTALLSDLKAQQLKAMAGGSESVSTAQSFGIYFESNQYTLFKGTSYSGADTDNFIVTQDANISLSTTFGSSQVVFSKISGEVASFVDGANTITVSSGGESRTITINRYGALTLN